MNSMIFWSTSRAVGRKSFVSQFFRTLCFDFAFAHKQQRRSRVRTWRFSGDVDSVEALIINTRSRAAGSISFSVWKLKTFDWQRRKLWRKSRRESNVTPVTTGFDDADTFTTPKNVVLEFVLKQGFERRNSAVCSMLKIELCRLLGYLSLD